MASKLQRVEIGLGVVSTRRLYNTVVLASNAERAGVRQCDQELFPFPIDTKNNNWKQNFDLLSTKYHQTMLSSSNLVALATLWASAVSGTDAHWGSRRSAMVRRGSYVVEDPVAELVRDFFYVPAYPNSLMRPEGPFVDERSKVPSQPHFDVSEDEDGTVHLTMEVPGLSARDLNIEVENDHILRVNGIRTRRKNGHISETKFDHSIRLKDTVDPDRMEANLSSGILTITVPQKPTKIKKLPLSTDDKSILDSPGKEDQNTGN